MAPIRVHSTTPEYQKRPTQARLYGTARRDCPYDLPADAPKTPRRDQKSFSARALIKTLKHGASTVKKATKGKRSSSSVAVSF